MSEDINKKGISFWQLISKYKIEIPIIQRDYAQGRNDEKTKKIRNGFLDSIIESLEANKPLELDFVYGNIENNVLQPLDGQQRLTTLFLLHWFLVIKKTKKLQENTETLRNFSYETRISSREFCNELTTKGAELGEGITISEKINDSKWFFLSWKKDPTIKAMLTMLDAIEEKLASLSLEDFEEYWQKLSENSPITFHFKELKDIGLTDDLYVKMNARGVALTDFENFKARFEKHIEDNKWEENVLDPTKKFSHKIDTVWTDLFWKHRGVDNKIDDEYVKFFAGIAINNYAQNLDIIEDEKEFEETKKNLEANSKGKAVTHEAVKIERIEKRIQRLFKTPNEINPSDFSTKTSFDYLIRCLDKYSTNKNDEILATDLPLWNFCKNGLVQINNIQQIENNLFIEFIKSIETTYPQRALFYAQSQYLLNSKEYNQERFSEWIRVIRNIIQNSTIDSASGLISAIGLINELTNGCSDIYQYLSQNNVQSGFTKEQVNEEILKSSVIANQINDKSIIFSIEDTNFFKGKIKFALFCVDIETNGTVLDSNKLNSVFKVVKEHLDNSDISFNFRSALLTVRGNDFYNYWGTWSYGTNSHKRCLIENTADLNTNFTKGYYSDYLKDLIIILISKSLDKIIDDYVCPIEMPNWKCRLIKEPQLQDKYCKGHFFGYTDDNKAFLFYNRKRPNSRQDCKKID